MQEGQADRADGAFRVLLVEDDDNHARLFERALRRVDSKVELSRAEDGEAALLLLSTATPLERPNLVVLDLKLPGMSGIDVVARIKGAPETRTIPVIVLTSSDALSDRREAYLKHANSYLLKPVDGAYQSLLSELCAYWKELNRPAC
jgi:CheY-like chemotaxis protein